MRLMYAAAAMLWLSGCAAITDHQVGVMEGKLKPCPSAPRCVSSFASNARHAVPPLRLRQPAEEAWRASLQAVAAMPRTSIVENEGRYIRAEVVSPWHVYTDDLELLLRPEQGEIAVRSTGRIGYYDFEVNRERVESLRSTLAAQGVVDP